MIINHNIKSQFLLRFQNLVQQKASQTYEKLASAQKINRAANNPSGLAVSEKMRSQIRGLHMASRNTQDNISLIQTAEGYLQDITFSLQRLRELAVTSANGVFTDGDRKLIGIETEKMIRAIQKISEYAEFNKLKLFEGRAFDFHLGANMDQLETLYLEKLNIETLGIKDLDLSTQEKSNTGIGTVDFALKKVLKIRADLGAFQNRLEKNYRGILINQENTVEAESRIRDTEMAATQSRYLSLNIMEKTIAAQFDKIHQLNHKMIRTILSSSS